MRIGLMAIFLVVVASSVCFGQKNEPVQPGSDDQCPVCGMFTAKYTDFLAEIIFKDDSYVTFDGPKDMFKYYFNMAKYAKDWKPDDIGSIYVTEYYRLVLIDEDLIIDTQQLISVPQANAAKCLHILQRRPQGQYVAQKYPLRIMVTRAAAISVTL